MFNKYILDAFIVAYEKFKFKNAFCINEKFYNYNDFAISISKIRDAIKKSSFTNKNIGVIANDDLETYASIFAVWLEGLAYVPLHPKQPIDRSIEIIEQADVELILDSSEKTLFQRYKVVATNKIVFEEINLTPKQASESELAYILFTSGSTGKPKGVSISRGNVGAFMKSFFEAGFEINQDDRCLQAFDLTFDVSVQSYLVPLTRGACTYTIPHDQIKYSYIYGLLEDHKITFGAMAPSMIRYLRPYFDEINAPSMRYNILTAEASPYNLVKEWMECIPNARVFDYYGPTEATIYCTYYEVGRNNTVKTLNGMLSIGKPMAGLFAVIIENDKIIENINQKGELCIGGPQVTPGYWKNQEKNNSSFINLDFNGNNVKFYRTGDSCYIDEDGDLMLSGRIDYQVKIQGYRIELGEIEYHVREFLEGFNAVAIPFTNKTGNTELALFVESSTFNIESLKKHLSSKLPNYMVPSKIILKDIFPINSNGKVDRNVLKKLLEL